MSAPKIDAGVSLTVVSAKTASLAEILNILDRDGGLIVHDMLSPQTVASLREELDPTSDSTSVGPKVDSANVNYFWGEQTKRFTRLAQRSQTFADQVLIHPLLIAIADALLKPHCASYWMNTGQMMIVMPSGAPQYMHRDSDDWPAMCGPTKPVCQISCMFALSDFTAENGATRVAPGSHQWSDFSRAAIDSEITQAVMPAGSGMIYTGKTLHSAGANKTDVVMLEATLLGIEELATEYMASIEFSGMIREEPSASPSPFREVWNMTKSKSGGAGWLVAGVQALQ